MLLQIIDMPSVDVDIDRCIYIINILQIYKGGYNGLLDNTKRFVVQDWKILISISFQFNKELLSVGECQKIFISSVSFGLKTKHKNIQQP